MSHYFYYNLMLNTKKAQGYITYRANTPEALALTSTKAYMMGIIHDSLLLCI